MTDDDQPVTGSLLAAHVPVSLLRSPAFRSLSRSALLAVCCVLAEKAEGRTHVSAGQFIRYGIGPETLVLALEELRRQSILKIQRHTARSHSFGIDSGYKTITEAQAIKIRDEVRGHSVKELRKQDRATLRVIYEQRLTATGASVTFGSPALAALAELQLCVFALVAEAIECGVDLISYEDICEWLNVGRCGVARAIRQLLALGLLDAEPSGTRNRRRYRLGTRWQEIEDIDEAARIAAAVSTPRRRTNGGMIDEADRGKAASA